MVAERLAPMVEAALAHREVLLREQLIGSALEFELGVHESDLLRVLALALGPQHPEELRALEDHCHVEAREGAVATPECYAADRPDWPNKPSSDATPHGTTYTRAPCPCSESPEWSGSARRFHPGFSGCASDWAEGPGHGSSARRGHRDCPGWVAVEIVAAGSKRPTCLFFVWSLCSRFCSPLQTRSILNRRFTVQFRISAEFPRN